MEQIFPEKTELLLAKGKHISHNVKGFIQINIFVLIVLFVTVMGRHLIFQNFFLFFLNFLFIKIFFPAFLKVERKHFLCLKFLKFLDILAHCLENRTFIDSLLRSFLEFRKNSF